METLLKNRAHAGQLKQFSGLKFGAISPTDLDAFLDFGDRLFIFVEAKYKNSPLPFGQRLALERLCDATHNPPHRHSILILTSHESDGDIQMSETIVQQYRLNRVWYQATDITLREAIEMFYSNFAITKKEDKNG